MQGLSLFPDIVPALITHEWVVCLRDRCWVAGVGQLLRYSFEVGEKEEREGWAPEP